jgi:hypothetical protein
MRLFRQVHIKGPFLLMHGVKKNKAHNLIHRVSITNTLGFGYLCLLSSVSYTLCLMHWAYTSTFSVNKYLLFF